MEKAVIAFIGLGKMGSVMATNISRAGYPLVVWNRSVDKATPLVELGAKLAESPAAAAAEADFVISSLADDNAIRTVVSEPSGILAGIRSEAIHIGTSTVSPKLADELATMHEAKGRHYVSGPVIGRVPAAEAAQLLSFLAGKPELIKNIRPLVATYAPQIIVVGEQPGQALTAKLIANFLGASAMDLIGQTLAWVEKSGLSTKLFMHVLDEFFAHPATKEYVTKIGKRDFDTVGFTVSGGLKDIRLMHEATGDVKLSLSSVEALRVKLEQSIAKGWQDKDWSCFTEIDRG